MTQVYNDPANGLPSSIGEQTRTDFILRKALTEARQKQYFTQLANSVNMPPHYGKELKAYHYLPLLHDANMNDQGIDANGATTKKMATIGLTLVSTARFAMSCSVPCVKRK